jgi:hypothetical protein
MITSRAMPLVVGRLFPDRLPPTYICCVPTAKHRAYAAASRYVLCRELSRARRLVESTACLDREWVCTGACWCLIPSRLCIASPSMCDEAWAAVPLDVCCATAGYCGCRRGLSRLNERRPLGVANKPKSPHPQLIFNHVIPSIMVFVV